MRPLENYKPKGDEVGEALAWHDGDALATIETLLADCAHLRQQIAIADRAMSRGFTRGWRPVSERGNSDRPE
ncbi:hypothetical protein [Shinella sp. BE166]|uniref:hypothetical protein n=1 Tax=unclassified Shinella TaxID=2643062 RepID=UPI003EBEFC9C